MEIKPIVPRDKEWYMLIEYAKNCSWRAGLSLANSMAKEEFHDWERVFIAVEGWEIAGYCVFTKKDCIENVPYTPYVGFIFVGEKFRGKRLSENMIDTVMRYAKELGFHKIYLTSHHVTLYEKYGFTVIDKQIAFWGVEEKIYVKDIE